MKVLIFAVLVAVAVAQSTSEQPVCQDDPAADCWSKPNNDCFGIYEPWSRAHCGLRCGYCGTPPCVDEVSYCDRYGRDSCTNPAYDVWARKTCRKFCNLCDVIPPTGSGTTNRPPTGTVIPGVITEVRPPEVATTEATTTPHVNYSVATGTVHTFVLIGERAFNTDNCTYKGFQYPPQTRWNDGCELECACMDAKANRIVCQERCTSWETTGNVGNCRLVQEIVVHEGVECNCPRLTCE